MFRKTCVALICWMLQLMAFGQSNKSVKVLFVGNSYTSRANIPAMTSSIGSALGIEIDQTVSTAEGATLKDHWNSKKGLETRSLIANGDYDLVIIQDQSMRPIQKPHDTLEDIQKFSTLAKKHNLELGLFMTWPKEHSTHTQNQLDKTYREGAKTTNAILFPVGTAWQFAKELNTKIKLYDYDGSHPSLDGGYLTALVFAIIITKEFKLETTKTVDEINMLNLPESENKFFIEVLKKVMASVKYDGG